MELWRDIKGFEGKYQVSDLGNVRSLNYRQTGEVSEIKQTLDSGGYKSVHLSIGGNDKRFKVHRLVADAFIENPFPEKWDQVNHIDEDKFNNRVENLEWCDQKYNLNYGTRNERISSTKRNGNTSKRVICVETGEIFPSVREVERSKGYSQGHVSECCRGEIKSSYGYHWKYIESGDDL
jgi:hypothetical protein